MRTCQSLYSSQSFNWTTACCVAHRPSSKQKSYKWAHSYSEVWRDWNECCRVSNSRRWSVQSQRQVSIFCQTLYLTASVCFIFLAWLSWQPLSGPFVSPLACFASSWAPNRIVLRERGPHRLLWSGLEVYLVKLKPWKPGTLFWPSLAFYWCSPHNLFLKLTF